MPAPFVEGHVFVLQRTSFTEGGYQDDIRTKYFELIGLRLGKGIGPLERAKQLWVQLTSDQPKKAGDLDGGNFLLIYNLMNQEVTSGNYDRAQFLKDLAAIFKNFPHLFHYFFNPDKHHNLMNVKLMSEGDEGKFNKIWYQQGEPNLKKARADINLMITTQTDCKLTLLQTVPHLLSENLETPLKIQKFANDDINIFVPLMRYFVQGSGEARFPFAEKLFPADEEMDRKAMLQYYFDLFVSQFTSMKKQINKGQRSITVDPINTSLLHQFQIFFLMAMRYAEKEMLIYFSARQEFYYSIIHSCIHQFSSEDVLFKHYATYIPRIFLKEVVLNNLNIAYYVFQDETMRKQLFGGKENSEAKFSSEELYQVLIRLYSKLHQQNFIPTSEDQAFVYYLLTEVIGHNHNLITKECVEEITHAHRQSGETIVRFFQYLIFTFDLGDYSEYLLKFVLNYPELFSSLVFKAPGIKSFAESPHLLSLSGLLRLTKVPGDLLNSLLQSNDDPDLFDLQRLTDPPLLTILFDSQYLSDFIVAISQHQSNSLKVFLKAEISSENPADKDKMLSLSMKDWAIVHIMNSKDNTNQLLKKVKDSATLHQQLLILLNREGFTLESLEAWYLREYAWDVLYPSKLQPDEVLARSQLLSRLHPFLQDKVALQQIEGDTISQPLLKQLVDNPALLVEPKTNPVLFNITVDLLIRSTDKFLKKGNDSVAWNQLLFVDIEGAQRFRHAHIVDLIFANENYFGEVFGDAITSRNILFKEISDNRLVQTLQQVVVDNTNDEATKLVLFYAGIENNIVLFAKRCLKNRALFPLFNDKALATTLLSEIIDRETLNELEEIVQVIPEDYFHQHLTLFVNSDDDKIIDWDWFGGLLKRRPEYVVALLNDRMSNNIEIFMRSNERVIAEFIQALVPGQGITAEITDELLLKLILFKPDSREVLLRACGKDESFGLSVKEMLERLKLPQHDTEKHIDEEWLKSLESLPNENLCVAMISEINLSDGDVTYPDEVWLAFIHLLYETDPSDPIWKMQYSEKFWKLFLKKLDGFIALNDPIIIDSLKNLRQRKMPYQQLILLIHKSAPEIVYPTSVLLECFAYFMHRIGKGYPDLESETKAGVYDQFKGATNFLEQLRNLSLLDIESSIVVKDEFKEISDYLDSLHHELLFVLKFKDDEEFSEATIDLKKTAHSEAVQAFQKHYLRSLELFMEFLVPFVNRHTIPADAQEGFPLLMEIFAFHLEPPVYFRSRPVQGPVVLTVAQRARWQWECESWQLDFDSFTNFLEDYQKKLIDNFYLDANWTVLEFVGKNLSKLFDNFEKNQYLISRLFLSNLEARKKWFAEMDNHQLVQLFNIPDGRIAPLFYQEEKSHQELREELQQSHKSSRRTGRTDVQEKPVTTSFLSGERRAELDAFLTAREGKEKMLLCFGMLFYLSHNDSENILPLSDLFYIWRNLNVRPGQLFVDSKKLIQARFQKIIDQYASEHKWLAGWFGRAGFLPLNESSTVPEKDSVTRYTKNLSRQEIEAKIKELGKSVDDLNILAAVLAELNQDDYYYQYYRAHVGPNTTNISVNHCKAQLYLKIVNAALEKSKTSLTDNYSFVLAFHYFNLMLQLDFNLIKKINLKDILEGDIFVDYIIQRLSEESFIVESQKTLVSFTDVDCQNKITLVCALHHLFNEKVEGLSGKALGNYQKLAFYFFLYGQPFADHDTTHFLLDCICQFPSLLLEISHIQNQFSISQELVKNVADKQCRVLQEKNYIALFKQQPEVFNKLSLEIIGVFDGRFKQGYFIVNCAAAVKHFNSIASQLISYYDKVIRSFESSLRKVNESKKEIKQMKEDHKQLKLKSRQTADVRSKIAALDRKIASKENDLRVFWPEDGITIDKIEAGLSDSINNIQSKKSGIEKCKHKIDNLFRFFATVNDGNVRDDTWKTIFEKFSLLKKLIEKFYQYCDSKSGLYDFLYKCGVLSSPSELNIFEVDGNKKSIVDFQGIFATFERTFYSMLFQAIRPSLLVRVQRINETLAQISSRSDKSLLKMTEDQEINLSDLIPLFQDLEVFKKLLPMHDDIDSYFIALRRTVNILSVPDQYLTTLKEKEAADKLVEGLDQRLSENLKFDTLQASDDHLTIACLLGSENFIAHLVHQQGGFTTLQQMFQKVLEASRGDDGDRAVPVHTHMARAWLTDMRERHREDWEFDGVTKLPAGLKR